MMPASRLEAMHAGRRLKEIIKKEARLKVEAFADELGRSRAMIYNYFEMERFTLTLYEEIAAVLRKYNVDPSPLNPSGGISYDDPAELRELLRGIDDACLPNVRKMLTADHATKIALLALVDDRIERK
jgi:transcriptional regulator with XRE-family HTH domain